MKALLTCFGDEYVARTHPIGYVGDKTEHPDAKRPARRITPLGARDFRAQRALQRLIFTTDDHHLHLAAGKRRLLWPGEQFHKRERALLELTHAVAAAHHQHQRPLRVTLA